uniref:Putative tnf receptor-associated factor 6 n=1 Tax=Ornithodoros turicata TaxID=34597 RepID=A0A2R5L4R4_9ACAR
MPKVVWLRGLPGGPHRIELTDEISHRNVCTQCEMFSVPMYNDEKKHIFCDACVQAASKDGHIFCKMENRKVLLDDLFESHEAVIAFRSMKLYCPNKKTGCKDMCTIHSIKEHYMNCVYTTILCMVCKSQVNGVDYDAHLRKCAPPYVQCERCLRGMKQEELQSHTCKTNSQRSTGVSSERDLYNHRSVSASQQHDAQAVTVEADSRVRDTTSRKQMTVDHHSQDTGANLGSAKNSEGDRGPQETRQCVLCKKRVKLLNWEKHKQHCEAILELCDICHKYFARNCIQEHKLACREVHASSPISALVPPENNNARPSPKEDIAITVPPSSSNKPPPPEASDGTMDSGQYTMTSCRSCTLCIGWFTCCTSTNTSHL